MPPCFAGWRKKSKTQGDPMTVDLDRLDEMRREIAPLMIPWWNKRAVMLDRRFPVIPDDWVPWPEVCRAPKEGTLDGQCFSNAKYLNREYSRPLVLGIHFNWQDVMDMLRDKPPTKIPFAHAVNLDNHGRVVDATWGVAAQATGLMVGRGFGIAPTSDLKTYCKDLGFKK